MLFYKNHKVYMNGNYPAIFLNGQNAHIHRLEWEKHYGKIPKGYIVHHKDEDKLNWSIENLELLSKSEHIKAHKNIVRRKGIKVIAKRDDMILYLDSIQKAAKACGTYTASIRRILKHKQHKANGWAFERM